MSWRIRCYHGLWRYDLPEHNRDPMHAPPAFTVPMRCTQCGVVRPFPDETPPAFIVDFLKEQERDKRERERRVRPEIPAPTTQEEEG